MAASKEQESLSNSIKIITRTWEDIIRHTEEYREEIESTYFKDNPMRKDLFMSPKYEEELTDEVLKKRFFKHSTAVINFMDNLIEFVNGNEEIKPILFVLGKHHKTLNVNEKMFLEMKDTICKVIKMKSNMETSKAWSTVLQYVLINYVFEGMHMTDPF